jgi:hypothetical protein
MTAEAPRWARRIREERAKRLWSQKTTATRLRDAADPYTRARLPDAESIQRRVRAHEAGQHYPGEVYVELYCRAFGLTRDALFGEGAGSGRANEHGAAGLVTWIGPAGSCELGQLTF